MTASPHRRKRYLDQAVRGVRSDEAAGKIDLRFYTNPPDDIAAGYVEDP
ncbi:MAG: hypothetical protein ABSB01_24025 [Streptosporangiaceae bacterium]|jgi:hypothetical protein